MTHLDRLFNFLGGNAVLLKKVIRELFQRPFYGKLFLEQLQSIGVASVPVILVVAGSVGMVMALQFGIGLQKFGGKLYIPKVVSVSIVRELGPMFASLMFAARVGAGMTSEIGSMVVTQQIDAIRALGTSPIKRIVIPRILASIVALPILCVFANAIGIAGGMLVSSTDLGLDAGFYWQKVTTTVALADYFSGFGKTIFFALFVAIPASYYGLAVRGGTRGVGSATTTAVVVASILIVVGDYFLTKLFWIIEQWVS